MASKYLFISFWFLLCLVLYLSGCVTKADLIQQMEQSESCCEGFREFLFEEVPIGSEINFNIDSNSSIAKFSTGNSYFKAFELPKASDPHFIIINSYLISLSTDPHFSSLALVPGDIKNPHVFPPLVITLDDNHNVVRRIDPSSFQMAAEFDLSCGLLGCRPSGSSRLQIAIRITKDSREKYLVIATMPDLARGQREFPKTMSFTVNPYWPYGPYGGKLLHGVDYFPMGKLSLVVLPPEEIGTYMGKRILNWPEIQPNQKISLKWFSVNSPNTKGYHVRTVKDRVDLAKFSSDGSSIVLFSNCFAAPWHDLNSGTRSQVAELKTHFEDFAYEWYDISLDGAQCRRIDFRGKNIQHFLAPIKGYDIYCSLQEKDGDNWVWVRIGANITYNLEESEFYMPDELEGFVNTLKFH